MTWDEVLNTLPLVAILRGLRPDEAVDVALALCDAGFKCLEVPLNSPQPLESIRLMRAAVGARALVGAGTVLSATAVAEVAAAGGQIIISPNADPVVIGAAKRAGLISLPAFFTPTEAFTALAAGADALKLFPAEAAPPAVLKAVCAVLPPDLPIFPVGGIDVDAMAAYRQAGAAGFGLGSAIFKPGMGADEVGSRARDFVRAWSNPGVA